MNVSDSILKLRIAEYLRIRRRYEKEFGLESKDMTDREVVMSALVCATSHMEQALYEMDCLKGNPFDGE